MTIKPFELILNKPEYVLPLGDSHSLKSIFSTCFEFPTDSLDIIWLGERIKLSYKYQLPYLIFTFLEMIKDLCSNDINHHSAYLVTDQLEANWDLSWHNNQISLKSSWLSAPGHIEGKLNEKSELVLNIGDFLKEWYKLLHLMAKLINSTGIQINDYHFNKVYFDTLLLALDKRLKNNPDEISFD